MQKYPNYNLNKILETLKAAGPDGIKLGDHVDSYLRLNTASYYLPEHIENRQIVLGGEVGEIWMERGLEKGTYSDIQVSLENIKYDLFDHVWNNTINLISQAAGHCESSEHDCMEGIHFVYWKTRDYEIFLSGGNRFGISFQIAVIVLRVEVDRSGRVLESSSMYC